MEDNKDSVIVVDIKELLYILAKKIWLIGLTGLFTAFIFGIISLYMVTPIYTSTAKIYVVSRQDDSVTTSADLALGTELTKDYMILITSKPVLEEVLKKTNTNLTANELKSIIGVNNPDKTRILEIKVSYYDAVAAKKLVDAIADVSSEQMVDIMEIKRVNVVEYGEISTIPSNYIGIKSFLIGGAAGIAATSIIIILIHMLNDNIRTSDDVEKYLKITTLGMIPLEGNNKNIKKKSRQPKNKTALAS